MSISDSLGLPAGIDTTSRAATAGHPTAHARPVARAHFVVEYQRGSGGRSMKSWAAPHDPTLACWPRRTRGMGRCGGPRAQLVQHPPPQRPHLVSPRRRHPATPRSPVVDAAPRRALRAVTPSIVRQLWAAVVVPPTVLHER